MPVFFGRDGKDYETADRPSGRGGRGSFFRCTNHPSVGVKVLNDPAERAECADRGDILSRWVRVPGTMLPITTVSETPGGPPVGYALPLADGEPLGVILNPAARAAAGRVLGLRDLIGIAANAATGMAENHAALLVEGDVNPGNRMVGRAQVNGRHPVLGIDADSFAFRGTTRDGRLAEFRCPVAQPEYTPPEFARLNLKTVSRGPTSDVFGLAVLIWMLAKEGSHPFAWRHLRGGSVPAIQDIIKAGDWPFAPKTPLPADVRPLDVGVTFASLPPTIQEYFTRAFTGLPSDRPTADEWARALTDYERTLPQGAALPVSPNTGANAPRAFLSALAGMANAANVLRAVNRLLARLRAKTPLPAARRRRMRRSRSFWWVLSLVLAAATSAVVPLTLNIRPRDRSPEPALHQEPAPRKPQPGRFEGVPLWDELDSEIQSERRKP